MPRTGRPMTIGTTNQGPRLGRWTTGIHQGKHCSLHDDTRDHLFTPLLSPMFHARSGHIYLPRSPRFIISSSLPVRSYLCTIVVDCIRTDEFDVPFSFLRYAFEVLSRGVLISRGMTCSRWEGGPNLRYHSSGRRLQRQRGDVRTLIIMYRSSSDLRFYLPKAYHGSSLTPTSSTHHRPIIYLKGHPLALGTPYP